MQLYLPSDPSRHSPLLTDPTCCFYKQNLIWTEGCRPYGLTEMALTGLETILTLKIHSHTIYPTSEPESEGVRQVFGPGAGRAHLFCPLCFVGVIPGWVVAKIRGSAPFSLQRKHFGKSFFLTCFRQCFN